MKGEQARGGGGDDGPEDGLAHGDRDPGRQQRRIVNGQGGQRRRHGEDGQQHDQQAAARPRRREPGQRHRDDHDDEAVCRHQQADRGLADAQVARHGGEQADRQRLDRDIEERAERQRRQGDPCARAAQFHGADVIERV
jgi:hypothetical protein